MQRPLCKKQKNYANVVTTSPKDQSVQMISVQTIQILKQSLVTILQTAQQQQATLNTIWMQRQLEYEAEIQTLQSINQQLQQRYQQAQVRIDQVQTQKIRLMRQITQYQSKQQFMSNHLSKFQKVIQEKEAVIKYLEQKQETYTRKSTNVSSRNSESSFNDISNLSSIPLLNLQNLARPKTFQQCKTNRMAPSTDRVSMLYEKKPETPFAKIDCSNLKSNFIKYQSQLSLREKEQSDKGTRIQLLSKYNTRCDYNVWKHMNKSNKSRHTNIQSSFRDGSVLSSRIASK